ncbi:MAG: T9SS type A sorting domain-containing protein, partial [Candidatus Cloacimonadales bacterium]|nr:T9SS type A sorting domain-containing protein [Candidatus Cloacimonadales bacterium]
TSGLEVPTTPTLLYTVTLDIIDPNATAGLSWNSSDTAIYDSSGNGVLVLELLGGDDSPLPVNLSSFTAEYDDTPILYWTTQSESDNLGWNLYRGLFENGYDPENFIQINSELIPGMGNCTIPTDYSFVDEYPVVEGSTYWYWLECVSTTNQLAFFGPVPLEIPIVGEIPVVMLETFMNPNYPNPFNPSTLINFNIEEGEKGTLTIFNIKGQVVLQEKFEAGQYNYEWNAKGCTSGVYFYRLLTPSKDITKKMLLMK